MKKKWIIPLLLLLVVAGISGYKLVSTLLDYREAADFYGEMAEDFVQPRPTTERADVQMTEAPPDATAQAQSGQPQGGEEPAEPQSNAEPQAQPESQGGEESVEIQSNTEPQAQPEPQGREEPTEAQSNAESQTQSEPQDGEEPAAAQSNAEPQTQSEPQGGEEPTEAQSNAEPQIQLEPQDGEEPAAAQSNAEPQTQPASNNGEEPTEAQSNGTSQTQPVPQNGEEPAEVQSNMTPQTQSQNGKEPTEAQSNAEPQMQSQSQDGEGLVESQPNEIPATQSESQNGEEPTEAQSNAESQTQSEPQDGEEPAEAQPNEAPQTQSEPQEEGQSAAALPGTDAEAQPEASEPYVWPDTGSEVALLLRSTEIQPPIEVDFEALKAVNPDVVGWIYCADTMINYPVLQGKTNDTYLHRMMNGRRSPSGSIFLDSMCEPDFSGENSLLYGHHMKDGSMFAGLQKFKDQDYYDAHSEMWLLTPERDYMIQPFAGFLTETDGWIYYVTFGEDATKLAYVQDAFRRSYFKCDVAPVSEDRLITLSTCDYTFKNARFVLVGLLVPVVEPDPEASSSEESSEAPAPLASAETGQTAMPPA